MLVDKEDEIVLGRFVTRYNTFVQLQIYKLFFFLFFDDISFNVRLEFINIASFLSNGNSMEIRIRVSFSRFSNSMEFKVDNQLMGKI